MAEQHFVPRVALAIPTSLRPEEDWSGQRVTTFVRVEDDGQRPDLMEEDQEEYMWEEFWDDMSGKPLDTGLVIEARDEEMPSNPSKLGGACGVLAMMPTNPTKQTAITRTTRTRTPQAARGRCSDRTQRAFLRTARDTAS